jgi:1,4-alpha-glucan branching enzyme
MKQQSSSNPKRVSRSSAKTVSHPGIKRKYSKDRSTCQVTFWLSKQAVPGARVVAVAGDFNNWDMHAHKMKKLKSGDYSLMVELEPGKEYEFRYLIDETHWKNAWNADKYVWSPYGNCENAVLIV